MKKILLLTISILMVLYLGGAVFFMGHFMPRTSIDGVNVAMMNRERAVSVVNDIISGYSLKLIGREGMEETVSASDIALEAAGPESVEMFLRSESPFLWPVSLFRNREFHVSESKGSNEEALLACVRGLSFFRQENMHEPVNATYVLSKGRFEVVPEYNGTIPNEARCAEALGTAVRFLRESLNLDEEGCYEDAEIKADNEVLLSGVETMNRYCAADISIPFGETKEVLSASTIAMWLTLPEGDEVPIIDEEAAAGYVKEIANAHDTFSTDRLFRTATGVDITVPGGNYGWWMDREKTLEKLLTVIREGTNEPMEPEYKLTAASHGTPDYGDTYVEIDLNAQHVYVFQGGAMVFETDCVSGKAINNNITPQGTYFLNYKQRDATLRGEDYATPVKYWMPFNGNVGMHDANWRREFGGTLYLRNGSHGCVNLPPAAAAEIFSLVEKNQPIIVYGGMNKDEANTYIAEERQREAERAALIEQLAAIGMTIEEWEAQQAAAAAAQEAAALAEQTPDGGGG